MLKSLWNDEAGVILSAELVLIGTILVIGMIAGLVELQCSVVGELNDLGDAIGNLDQGYLVSGINAGNKGGVGGTPKGYTRGAVFTDAADECDCTAMSLVCTPTGEK